MLKITFMCDSVRILASIGLQIILFSLPHADYLYTLCGLGFHQSLSECCFRLCLCQDQRNQAQGQEGAQGQPALCPGT